MDLLTSIEDQSVSPSEVLLVDGGSSDDTVKMLEAWCASNDTFRVIRTDGATPGRGRNLGILAARGSWIALTDAGIRLDMFWLEELLAVRDRSPGVDAVFGGYEPVRDSYFKECATIAYLPPRRSVRGGQVRGRFIASSMLSRDAWARAGTFPDLRAAEDLIFMRRLLAANANVVWAPRAIVHWEIAGDLLTTYRRIRLYSFHNAKAGQQRYWHYGLARNYMALAPFVVGALRWRWLLVGLPLAMAARAERRVWTHRERRGIGWALNPIRVVTTAAILSICDVASFAGWVSTAFSDPTPLQRG